MKAKRGIGLMTVDYIQLVRATDMGRSEWDTVARVTHVSNRLKDLSLSLHLPILALCQLSRAVEKDGRDPQLSDLRDSGAIEQDAQKVIFLYVNGKKREEMEKAVPTATKHKRPVVANVMKHKDGETGIVPFWLYPPYFRFATAKVSETGEPFVDDQLPSQRDDDWKDMRQRPAYMPMEEGMVHGEEQHPQEPVQKEIELK
jgi:replicative DNA helicase